MGVDAEKVDDLSREEMARFVLDVLHRSLLHYGLWFTEVRHQMGTARALEVLKNASERSFEIQLKRLCQTVRLRT